MERVYEQRRLHQTSKRHQDDYAHMKTYLDGVVDRLKTIEFDRRIQLPTMGVDEEQAEKQVNIILNGKGDDVMRQTLKQLLQFSSRGKLRGIRVEGLPTLIQFSQTVDDDLDQMIILDASANIRNLVRHDKSVTIYPLPISKSYASVTLKVADVSSSKSSFDENKDQLKNYLSEVDQLLKTEIPTSEPVIVFCHMDVEKQVREHFEHVNQLGRINILHWGQHRASNHYRDIEYVITIGVQYRDRKEIAASLVGQTGVLTYPLADNDITTTMHSEQADLLYQGFSRGHSRKTINGHAGEQTIYLFHPERDSKHVVRYLQDVMPQLVVQEYIPKFLKPKIRKDAVGYNDLAEKILDYVAGQPASLTKLSLQSIKSELLGETAVPDKTWRKAVDRFKDQIVGWDVVGRSIVRKS